MGLTTVSVPKSYDISELGLSEGAVKDLLMLKITGGTSIVSRLLEHRSFPTLIYQIKAYFYDEVANGVLGRNKMFELATASLDDLRKEQPEKSGEIRGVTSFINAEKFSKHEIDIEKIKNTFMAILRDIKKDIENGEPEGAAVMSDMIQQIRALMPDVPAELIGAEQVAVAITQVLEHTGVFDEKTMAMFQATAQSALEELEEKSKE